MRKNSSDEKGLFLSLPQINLYDHVTDTCDKCDLIIESYPRTGIAKPLYFETSFIVGQYQFYQNGTFSDDVLLITKSQTSSAEKDNKPIKLALYIKYNIKTQSLDFFDAFFCIDAPLPTDFFDDEYEWKPFILGPIRSNHFSVDVSDEEQPINRNFLLDIDPATSMITGVVLGNDCLYNTRGIVLDNSDQLAGVIPFADMLIDNAFVDSEYMIHPIPQNGTNNVSRKIFDVKNEIYKVRALEKGLTLKDMQNAILNAEGFKDYQNSLKKHKKETQNKISQIQLMQYDIAMDRRKLHNEMIKTHNNGKRWEFYTALCLLVKDENDYIEEWLRAWDKCGIEHFYIYDNGSKVPIKQTVKSISGGIFAKKCTFINFSQGYKHMQYDCYEHCLANFGNDCFWIGFVDTDEMLEFTDPEVTNINSFLKDFENDFGLWIPWECYNANNHVEKPKSGTQKDNYTKTIINPLGLYGKVFIQPYRTRKMYVHLGIGKNRYDTVVTQMHAPYIETVSETSKQYFTNNRGCFTKVKINHYITRSFEDWVNKMNRGSCDPNFRRKFDVFFDYNPDLLYLKNDPNVQELLRSQQGYVHG